MTDIANQTKWFKAFQNTASDLLATVTPANLRGIIPNPHTATRISKGFSGDANAGDKLYTVDADEILFISSAWVIFMNLGAGDTTSLFEVYNGADVLQYALFKATVKQNTGISNSNSYVPGLVLPATWYIWYRGHIAGNNIGCGFHGWIEDV